MTSSSNAVTGVHEKHTSRGNEYSKLIHRGDFGSIDAVQTMDAAEFSHSGDVQSWTASSGPSLRSTILLPTTSKIHIAVSSSTRPGIAKSGKSMPYTQIYNLACRGGKLRNSERQIMRLDHREVNHTASKLGSRYFYHRLDSTYEVKGGSVKILHE
jgi:hypothetical protein